MGRVCAQCGAILNQYNPEKLCLPCQEKRLEKMITDDEGLVDAEGYAGMLGLRSAEQLKRLARKDLLAPRIPAITPWRWRRKDIEDWFKQKQQTGNPYRKTAMGICQ